jgi:aspartoacylase
MAAGKVLVVGGTHGNERNAPWLLEHWGRHPAHLNRAGLAVELAVGNPAALAAGVRYLDHDLNRCFGLGALADSRRSSRELLRARQLLADFGPQGTTPCAVVIDLHSTTAAMGNSLVLYGRRPADLALAAGIQAQLGLPIYLHEGDPAQSGFLVERWPCGVVIEVGPVPQGVITATICHQTALAVEAALATLAAARDGSLRLPVALTVHRHLCSLDLPRHSDGRPACCLHPNRQHRDWQPLRLGDSLFQGADGSTVCFEAEAAGTFGAAMAAGDCAWPVFINEAAYGEKGIALSLTTRECWPSSQQWGEALRQQALDLTAAC